jgi:hypothetical protein
MPEKLNTAIAVVGIDIGKNSSKVTGRQPARRNGPSFRLLPEGSPRCEIVLSLR